MKKIALFGGTFDPIHVGHLIMAQMACEAMKLDQVIFIPSFIPPHKSTRRLFTAQDRLKMVRLAVRGNDKFVASDFEVKQAKKSYSVDTVQHFYQKLGSKTKLYFIVGGDAVHTLHTWKNIDKIRQHVEFISVNRPGYVRGKAKNDHYAVTVQGIDISSTQIRERILKGKPIQYLVPDAVLRYIDSHQKQK